VFTSRIEAIRPQASHGSPARGAVATRGGGGRRSGMRYDWAEAASAIPPATAAASRRTPLLRGRGALRIARADMRYSEMPWTK
jgi:hypothetical protein